MKHLVLPICLLLAGCAGVTSPQNTGGGTTAPPAGSFPTGTKNTCDGERFGPLIGQDATALERVLFLGQVRVIRPGDLTTEDYVPARLNFNIGPDGRIVSIFCG